MGGRRLAKVRPEVMEMFVLFVRMNPTIAADDPALHAVLKAYDRSMPVEGAS